MDDGSQNITAEQCKDSGLALVLVCLLCHLAWGRPFLTHAAIVLLLVAMTYPLLYKPFAKCWLALSTTLGTIVSKVVLAVIFWLLVLPVGRMRRWLGKDAMQLKCWKNGGGSVFLVRNRRVAAEDLEHPY